MNLENKKLLKTLTKLSWMFYKKIINKGGISIEIKKISTSELKELRNKKYEYLILQGCGGDLNEWVDGITSMLKEEKIVNDSFSFKEIYSFKNDNITNIAFALNDKNINIKKLAMFRLSIRETFGAMWLSDYIDNGYLVEENKNVDYENNHIGI